MFGKGFSPFAAEWAASRRGAAFAAAYAGPFGWRGFGLGRMMGQGDLRLLALALIAEQPRHGYDIIKAIEEKTAGCYSPSPGIVYPTLTYLEEAEFATAEADGSKKRYRITDKGRAFLEENREAVAAILDRLSRAGERMARWREAFGQAESDQAGSAPLPRLVAAAIENLRETAADRLARDGECEPRIVEILARAAAELRKT
jgi:DNA-binding PadR family transcriptional regulator